MAWPTSGFQAKVWTSFPDSLHAEKLGVGKGLEGTSPSCLPSSMAFSLSYTKSNNSGLSPDFLSFCEGGL